LWEGCVTALAHELSCLSCSPILSTVATQHTIRYRTILFPIELLRLSAGRTSAPCGGGRLARCPSCGGPARLHPRPLLLAGRAARVCGPGGAIRAWGWGGLPVRAWWSAVTRALGLGGGGSVKLRFWPLSAMASTPRTAGWGPLAVANNGPRRCSGTSRGV